MGQQGCIGGCLRLPYAMPQTFQTAHQSFLLSASARARIAGIGWPGTDLCECQIGVIEGALKIARNPLVVNCQVFASRDAVAGICDELQPEIRCGFFITEALGHRCEVAGGSWTVFCRQAGIEGLGTG
jgi:hypothetical protein